MFDLFKELVEIVVEGGKELGEICTEGFNEMVIKGNKNYETSYEKKDRANQIMASAKSKYRTALEAFKSYYENTEKLLNEHYDYRRRFSLKVLKENVEFMKEVESTIDHIYNSYNKISEGTPKEIPDIYDATSNLLNCSKCLDKNLFAKISPEIFGVPVALGLGSQARRIEEANEYLSDAKDFREETNYEINKLEVAKVKLEYIREAIKEERYVLNLLADEMSEYITSIKGLIEKPKLNIKDGEIVRSYVKVTEVISNIFASEFIDSDGEVTNKYKKLLNQLRQVYEGFRGGI